MPTDFISATERYLLLTFALIICCTLYLNAEYKVIDSYNERVRIEQVRKQKGANNSVKSAPSFGLTNCFGGPAPWEFVYVLQYITIPISCFLLRKTSVKHFLTAIFLSLISVISFFFWYMETFRMYSYIERIPEEFKSVNQFVLYDSTGLEFILSILVAASFVLQIFVLLRFVIEKFHAKISFR